MEEIRRIRNQLLASCDWTQLPDVQMGATARAEWVAYRQALRDVTEDVTHSSEIVWPNRPDSN
ncbi:tail fiber assembly protein [uncultured Roseovarius sp.]|uniref:tail fiber assembly protein n=1 Tax=uncultured Roseovarius sp. TaxID=293344 RepID=UPI00261B5524|nr:tail fiber assembly protein [uncultured Roseovarius sp.]